MPDIMTPERGNAPVLRATMAPNTWNADQRTVELIFTTGAPVERFDWRTGRAYFEVLDVTESAVDLQRLNAGAPLLNTHASWSLADVVGVVEMAWIRDGEGRARVRFSDRPEVAGIVSDVASGIIRNVSVGYWVDKYETTQATPDTVEVRRATRWTPGEISLVPVPADPGAQLRSAPPHQPQQAPVVPENRSMVEMTNQVVEAPPAAPDHTAAVAAERGRVSDIMVVARQAGMDGEWVQRMIADGVPIDTARAQALEAVSARATARVPAEVAGARQDESETQSRLLENALLHRAQEGGTRFSERVVLDPGARQFRGFQLIDFARHSLEANGVKTRGMTRAEIARNALLRVGYVRDGGSGFSTSDFPNLLANTASKSLRDAYTYAPRTFLGWAMQKNLPDFKTYREVALSGAPQLAPIAETGEVTYGVIGEGAETWGLTRFGRAVAINYVAIINDDMGGFTRVPQMFGAEAAQLENVQVYGIVTANANLADGGALFNATVTTTTGGHDNLTSGGASALTNDTAGIAAVGALQRKIRMQRAPLVGGVAGRNLNLTGRYLILPGALEHVGNALFSQSVVPSSTGAANPYRGQYEIVIEPILDANSATAFYLMAEPARVDTVHYGYLEGESGPMVTSNVDFDTDGIGIKCMHNFGAKAIDFRGMAKSAGA